MCVFTSKTEVESATRYEVTGVYMISHFFPMYFLLLLAGGTTRGRVYLGMRRKRTFPSPTSLTRMYRTVRYHVHDLFMLLCIENAIGKRGIRFGWKEMKTNLRVFKRTCYRRRDDKKNTITNTSILPPNQTVQRNGVWYNIRYSYAITPPPYVHPSLLRQLPTIL